MSLYFAVTITILATFFYHILQSSISTTVNPIISLIVTYSVALIFSLIFLFFFPNKPSLIESFKQLNWASFGLGLAIFGMEVGFLLTYRLGWSISLGSVTINALAVIALSFFEVVFLKKSISATNFAGICFCAIGMVFANTKH